MRVGIYPAAFDPVHKGHIAFAKAAMSAHSLDRVFFLPEPNPRHKQGVKAFAHRANMVQLAIANEPSFGLMVLEDQEFTIQDIWPRVTSRFLGAELYMLVGNNPIKRLATWPHSTEFGRNPPTFIIASRNNPELQGSIQTLFQTRKFPLPYKILEAEYQTFSSPAIRLALKGGMPGEGLQYSVLEYIKSNGLYISGAT